MIVSEDQVSAALAYLADADSIAQARFNVTDAENKSKQTFSRLYLSYSGPVAEREARAISNPEYAESKSLEAEAIKNLEWHKAQARWSEALIEIFRTENANARAAERIR